MAVVRFSRWIPIELKRALTVPWLRFDLQPEPLMRVPLQQSVVSVGTKVIVGCAIQRRARFPLVKVSGDRCAGILLRCAQCPAKDNLYEVILTR